MRTFLIALLLMLAAAAAAGWYVSQDLNRFKPRVEALIARETGLPVRIEGDLGWRLWPPVSVSASDLVTEQPGQSWRLGDLSLDLEALTLLRDPAQWKVQSLTVRDLTLRDGGDRLEVSRATLRDLAPRQPAPLAAELVYTRAGGEPLPLQLDGRLRVDPDTQVLSLEDAAIDLPQVQGTCSLEARPRPGGAAPVAAAAGAAAAGQLVPVVLLRGYDWSGACQLQRAELRGEWFRDVAVSFRNAAGVAAVTVEAPALFGGSGQFELTIDARATPLQWTLEPTFRGVDSQALVDWLDQDLGWQAPLAGDGTLTAEGNSEADLLRSLSAVMHFDGGQGRIDTTAVREQLEQMSTLLNDSQSVSEWPEVWDYQRFVGDWRIQRQHHVMDFVLDNLTIDAEGVYAPDTDSIDLRAELTFADDPALPVFPLNPLLYDLPIPVRCRGPAQQPLCRLDADAAQRLVAEALTGGEDNALRARLEEKIETQVPPQYRDAARSLLELLGGSRSGGEAAGKAGGSSDGNAAGSAASEGGATGDADATGADGR